MAITEVRPKKLARTPSSSRALLEAMRVP